MSSKTTGVVVGRIIGVCGLNASGKSTVCSFFKDKGYHVFSLSDVLRQELKNRHIEESREALINIGNELRNKHGPGILATMALQTVIGGGGGEGRNKDVNYVIDSIRHPEEVRQLRMQKDYPFCLIGVDCSPETRYARLKSRARQGDNTISLEQFLRIDGLETNNPDPNGQQVGAVLALSDIRIDNNQDSSYEQFQHDVQQHLGGQVEAFFDQKR
ncbi:hypothetical protein SAMD00019534_089550 [Acytostelium subglobosum LB1]|uniref:hypothetical protein n=1 Tax=Acytostelium subglobosum LB1 TaxID=1410327 RepID=UPI000644E44E|nr:hypothetical protein SAMD00019534_089550 [Acytostelium subglobosum LB1]GAM25780.1 hypothetical protein SAMD00019534_089550 [Acytostelium subglobosum LB1]|eukprot:XP_012751298.1 hypothetical protein SAMD00019534_089550 [Acytostelium subglobosum LB1]